MPKKIKRIEDVSFDDNNINKGSEFGNFLLEKSIRENGFGRSILADKNGVIIAGNKTFEQATQIGLDKVRVVETTGDEIVIVQRTDLDINDQQGVELKILDNTISRHNYIEDAEIVAGLVDEFNIDPKAFGLTEAEIIKEEEKGGAETENITLKYTYEEYHAVKTALAKIAPTPEQAVWQLLGLEK